MLACPFLLLVALPQAPQRPSVKPAEAEVLVQDTRIELPGIPGSTKEARAQYKALRPELEKARQAIERELKDLYASPVGSHPLPASLKIPADRVRDAKDLIGIIQDQPYEDLEEKVLEAWDRWYSALTENRVGEPSENKRRGQPFFKEPPPEPLLETSQETQKQKELKQRLKGMQKSKTLQDAELRILGAHFILGSPGAGPGGPNSPIPYGDRAFEMAAEAKVDYDQRIQNARAHVVVAREYAPELSEAWAPLTNYLNTRLRDWVKAEEAAAPTPSADLLALKLHTRIALLERFRSAFWFAHVIWSYLASETQPAPLAPLRRIEQPNAAVAKHP